MVSCVPNAMTCLPGFHCLPARLDPPFSRPSCPSFFPAFHLLVYHVIERSCPERRRRHYASTSRHIPECPKRSPDSPAGHSGISETWAKQCPGDRSQSSTAAVGNWSSPKKSRICAGTVHSTVQYTEHTIQSTIHNMQQAIQANNTPHTVHSIVYTSQRTVHSNHYTKQAST